jgi:hypothetical protein
VYTQSYYDMLEALPKPGCAICNLLLVHTHRYIDAILYECVLDPDIQTAFRARRGLCNEHSWYLTRFKGVQLGVAILYEAALEEIVQLIEQNGIEPVIRSTVERFLGPNNRHGAALGERLAPHTTCFVCKSVALAEQRYVEVITRHITDAPLCEAYRNSEGLCLPHFRQVLAQVHHSDHLKTIVSIQKSIWLKLKTELSELIRKHSYEYAHEPMGDEMNSWLRAIARLAGERGVFGIDR